MSRPNWSKFSKWLDKAKEVATKVVSFFLLIKNIKDKFKK